MFTWLCTAQVRSITGLVCKEEGAEARAKVEDDFIKAVGSMRKVYTQSQVSAITLNQSQVSALTIIQSQVSAITIILSQANDITII